MLRRWSLPLAVVLLLAVPAGAADHSVTATPTNEFEPAQVTVDLGDTVTWTNQGGFHSVKFDDGSFEQPASGSPTWPEVKRTFDAPGVFKYHCEVHGGPGGVGMSGMVSVRDATGSVPEPVEEPPPGLSMTTKRKRSLEQVLKAVVLKARCAGGCTVSFAILDGEKRVGGRSANLDAGAPASKVEIKLKKKARKRLAKRTKPFKLVVEAHAVNTGGDQTLKRTVTVKP